MYFKDFPKFLYDFKNSDGKTTSTAIVRDITRNVRFRRDLLANVTVYDEYDVMDGETPEIIAEKVYGNPNYHWIVMLANESFDYRTDFPLDENSLVKHIEHMYPNSILSRTLEAAQAFSNIVLKIGINQTVFSDPKEQALRDWLVTNNYANIDGSATVNATDARSWLLIYSQSVTNPTAETYLKELLALENANPGTFPAILFAPEAYYGIHHYINAEGFIVDSDYPGATPVFNDAYLREKNEAKRRIKLISKDLVATILKNYKDIM